MMNNEIANVSSKMEKLAQYEATILRERPFVDKKPYSYNIISMKLSLIDDLELVGITGNDIIKKYNLEQLGW